MKRAFRALSYGLWFSLVTYAACGVGVAGCATGTSDDQTGGLGGSDSGQDSTTGQPGTGDEGGVNEDATTSNEDAPTSTEDATTPTEDGAAPTEDSASPEDAGTGEDSGHPEEDSGGATHDAGTDSGSAEHDAGTDSGSTEHDAGTDSGTTTQDAGTDSGTTAQDAGVDSGPPATLPTGSPCSGGAESCASGDTCAGGSEEDGGPGPFTCHQLCDYDAGAGNCTGSAVSSGGTSEPKNVPYCVIELTGTTPQEYLCTLPCNPVLAAGASGCPSGLVCVYSGTTDIPELTDCEPPGGVALGGTCTDDTVATSCAGGATCVVSGGGTSGTCRDVCRVGNNNDCPGAEDCHKFSGITNEMFGFCE